MKYGGLVLEKIDLEIILKHRSKGSFIVDYTHKHALETLDEDMADAIVLEAKEMPVDIIRLYSMVKVSSATGWWEYFQVVLPGEIDLANNKISVLSTLGASIIGYAEGDVIPYGTPIGLIPLKIEKVDQDISSTKVPRAHNDYRKSLPKPIESKLRLKARPNNMKELF